MADSCNIEPRLYEHIYREIGEVDALFLGMECDRAPELAIRTAADTSN